MRRADPRETTDDTTYIGDGTPQQIVNREIVEYTLETPITSNGRIVAYKWEKFSFTVATVRPA